MKQKMIEEIESVMNTYAINFIMNTYAINFIIALAASLYIIFIEKAGITEALGWINSTIQVFIFILILRDIKTR